MRLFIAVNFTEEFKAALLDWQAELKAFAEAQGAGKVNWSRPENLHLTLAFIGEYGDPDKVLRAMERVWVEQFELETGRGGRFGSLYWAGLADGRPAVALSEAVRRELKKDGIPFDEKPMSPHITVARELKLAQPPQIPVPKARMTAECFTLMKSERIGGRLTYTPLGSIGLTFAPDDSPQQ